MIKSNYIVFDCETGGLNETENPITQYAAVILDGKSLKEIDRWETFIKPYADLKISKESLDKTMVSMSDINSGITIQDFIKTATKWWDNHRVKAKNREAGRLLPVGHNIPFDLKFVNWALNYVSKQDIYEWMLPNFIDTLPLSKMAFGIEGNEKINLGASCELAKIKLTDAHGAMNDAESTAELLRWFVKRMRSKKGESSTSEEKSRKIGQDFFEFKCSK